MAIYFTFIFSFIMKKLKGKTSESKKFKKLKLTEIIKKNGFQKTN